jgi:nitroimidazol reductase NimA-like FMN-containing flavoprotein (pyridoxamine 5'-phosphate oxidase superfamily)
MPGYGILPADEGMGLLPWSWAVERLTRSHDYWLSTVRPDARPHAMPVWAVWLESALWFSSGGSSRKARNLAMNPWAVITTDDALEPVVVEGQAVIVSPTDERSAVERFAEASNSKYDTEYPVQFFLDNACFRIAPSRVYGLAEADFTGSPTRWTFD